MARDIKTLRGEIDRLDREIHDRLMRRARVARDIGKIKNGFAFRPGREAKVLRALLARHRGPLPKTTIARLWRETISAMTRLQSRYAIALAAPKGDLALTDLAREHFGLDTPLKFCGDAEATCRVVASGRAALGLLPIGDDGARAAWWTTLGDKVEIVARLPFIAGPGGEAVAIARDAADPSGDDVTLLDWRVRDRASEAFMTRALRTVGLRGRPVALTKLKGVRGASVLVEIDGYLAADDERFGILRRAGGPAILDLRRIGAYARPMRVR
jgi:chorismate mutase